MVNYLDLKEYPDPIQDLDPFWNLTPSFKHEMLQNSIIMFFLNYHLWVQVYTPPGKVGGMEEDGLRFSWENLVSEIYCQGWRDGGELVKIFLGKFS